MELHAHTFVAVLAITAVVSAGEKPPAEKPIDPLLLKRAQELVTRKKEVDAEKVFHAEFRDYTHRGLMPSEHVAILLACPVNPGVQPKIIAVHRMRVEVPQKPKDDL